jgi:hypothetical protein
MASALSTNFAEIPEEEIHGQIGLNIAALIALTRLFSSAHGAASQRPYHDRRGPIATLRLCCATCKIEDYLLVPSSLWLSAKKLSTV